jgi:hypothetical protein
MANTEKEITMTVNANGEASNLIDQMIINFASEAGIAEKDFREILRGASEERMQRESGFSMSPGRGCGAEFCWRGKWKSKRACTAPRSTWPLSARAP